MKLKVIYAFLSSLSEFDVHLYFAGGLEVGHKVIAMPALEDCYCINVQNMNCFISSAYWESTFQLYSVSKHSVTEVQLRF
ncbi:hypothetical protein A4A49_37493 [Nicotiana attenuata]|uniref:Uncharacterized protein n=1 Tax=Nicotiana attenuata TaxID=49451 RepID=A0A1J6JAJ7_NICAT|nr:hypothetical protein A4A49_37493 [Nicotiana attenuata]